MVNKTFNSLASWTSTDLKAATDNWIYTLTDEDVAEIVLAIEEIKSNNIPLTQINKENFKLSKLKGKLADILNSVENGYGIYNIKGFPLDRLSETDRLIGYMGIGTHLGKLVSQNKSGWLVSHIRDFNVTKFTNKTLLSQTNVELDSHTDSCDIVGLLCLNKATEGGLSRVASSIAIYNEILTTQPEYIPHLTKAIPHDRRGEIPPGEDPWYMMPIINYYKENLIVTFNRQYIDLAQQLYPNAPKLSSEEVDAINYFEMLTRSDKFRLDIMLEPGDIQLLNNKCLVHGRTEFIDSDDNKRHLLRLWICPEQSIELPEYYKTRWSSNTVGDRGGIRILNTTVVPTLTEAESFIETYYSE